MPRTQSVWLRQLAQTCLALTCALGVGLGCDAAEPTRGADRAPAPQPPTAPVVVEDAPVDAGYVGVVVPGEAVDIAPKTAGELVAVSVRIGDRVEAGDELARLDDQAARERLEMTESALLSAKARHRQAKIDARGARRKHGEARALVDQGHLARGISQEAGDQRSRATAVAGEARANVATELNAREQRKRELEETTLVAPFAGTIAERYVDPGTVVQPGTRVLRLIAGDTLWVRFAVSPADAQDIKVGDIVSATLEAVDAELEATVRQVAPGVDSASRLVIIAAQLELPDDLSLRPKTGAAATVRMFEAPDLVILE